MHQWVETANKPNLCFEDDCLCLSDLRSFKYLIISIVISITWPALTRFHESSCINNDQQMMDIAIDEPQAFSMHQLGVTLANHQLEKQLKILWSLWVKWYVWNLGHGTTTEGEKSIYWELVQMDWFLMLIGGNWEGAKKKFHAKQQFDL